VNPFAKKASEPKPSNPFARKEDSQINGKGPNSLRKSDSFFERIENNPKQKGVCILIILLLELTDHLGSDASNYSFRTPWSCSSSEAYRSEREEEKIQR
jgi:hypothetical protein